MNEHKETLDSNAEDFQMHNDLVMILEDNRFLKREGVGSEHGMIYTRPNEQNRLQVKMSNDDLMNILVKLGVKKHL